MHCVVSRDLIVEGAGDIAIPLYETFVVVHEPKEAS